MTAPFDRHGHGPAAVEQSVAGHRHLVPVFPIEGGVLAGQEHAPRAPRELVAERVGVGLGGRQPPAPRSEARHRSPLGPHLVDDPHRRHVVDARVDAHLVEQDHPGLLRGGIQRSHGLLDVRRRDHVLAVLDAQRRHHRVVGERQQADGDVALPDEALDGAFVCQVHLSRFAPRMTTHDLLGLAQSPARHGHLHVRQTQEVAHVRAGDHTGSQNEHLLHDPLLWTDSSK